MNQEDRKNEVENEQVDSKQDEDWNLDSLKKTDYLPPRKGYINDDIFKFGAGLAAFLAVAALLANHLFH